MAGSAVFQPADTVVPKKLHLGGADLISQNIVVQHPLTLTNLTLAP